MDKIAKVILLTVGLLLLFTIAAIASDTIELNQLVENAAVMDGQTVIVKGEAIGEAMERGDYAWVNINDKTNAMGIWMKSDDAKKINVFGDYKHIGDTVKVTGVFNRACVEHGGDMDIHSDSVIVEAAGYATAETFPFYKMIVAVGLALTALIMGVVYLRQIKK
ncbi:hypothetical protein [Acetobacterium bakii]|uniref:DNA-binding protein n=1 Tax=Acetobacterium bakii TaxID=52689 RepID=A0A0L6U4S7_9FIRM|nr:hypothetical protein [Acetobacterium bakii]KNZ43529.1 hypothetical protein AKG39_00345 [Acetobacterium bakii]